MNGGVNYMRKWLSLLLCLSMILSFVPAVNLTAFAEETTEIPAETTEEPTEEPVKKELNTGVIQAPAYAAGQSGLDGLDTSDMTIDIYIVAGQSNAEGESYITTSAPDTNGAAESERDHNTYEHVLYWTARTKIDGSHTANWNPSYEPVHEGLGCTTDYIGPELGMARYLNDKYDGVNNIALILKHAAGASMLGCYGKDDGTIIDYPISGSDWKENNLNTYNTKGTWYPEAMETEASKALGENRSTGYLKRELQKNIGVVYNELLEKGFKAENIHFVAMYWMQGESDKVLFKDSYVQNFQLMLDEITASMTQTTGRDYSELPVVVGEIADTSTAASNTEVNKNKAFIAIQNSLADLRSNIVINPSGALPITQWVDGKNVVVGSNPYHWRYPDAVKIGEMVAERAYAFANEEAPTGSHVHAACAGNEAGLTGTDVAWTELTNANIATFLEQGVGNTGLKRFKANGYYYLGEDINLTTALEMGKNQDIHLCLNGYTLMAPASSRAIAMYGGTLSVCDCGTTGKIVGNAGASKVIMALGGSRLYLYGGTLTAGANNASGYHSGVVYLGNDKTDAYGIAAGTASKFYMYGGTLDGTNSKVENNSSYSGRAGTLYVLKNCEFNLYGGTVTGGHTTGANAQAGNIQVDSGATINMYGGTIQNGSAAAYGGNIYGNGTLNLYGGEIKGGTATTGGGNIHSGGTVNVKGGTISGGTAKFGGNIYSVKTVNIESGTVTDGVSNTTSGGAGGGNIYMDTADAMLTVNGGTISNGISNAVGGGNVAQNNGKAVMNGGTVSGGKAMDMTNGTGGNWYVRQTSSLHAYFTMNGGTITGGECGEHGGNLACFGDFTMNGGKILNGTATADKNRMGGNISFYQNSDGLKSTFVMNGGTISDGHTTGGGCNIRVGKNVDFTMNGGTIGGGVNDDGWGTVVISGVARYGLTFNGGTIYNSNRSDLYIEDGAPMIHVGETVKSGSKVKLRMKTPGVFAENASMENIKYFISDDTAKKVRFLDGAYTLVDKDIHAAHCLCCGISYKDHTCETITDWQEMNSSNIASLLTAGKTGGKTLISDGNYYLTGNVTLPGVLEIAPEQNVTICLNGYALNAASGSRVFQVYGGTLNLTDCAGIGTVIGKAKPQGVIAAYCGSTVNQFGGTLINSADTSDTASPWAGILYLAQDAKTAYDRGAQKSVYNFYCGTMDASGVVYNATKDKDARAGAVYVLNNCEFNMYGGEIIGGTLHKASGTKDCYGGAMRIESKAVLNMYGGVIRDGKSDATGGNISCGGTINMYGGKICGGQSVSSAGGNIFASEGSAINIHGGVISGGKAATNGGNIYSNNIVITMDGGEIKDGAAQKGANIYQNNDTTSKDAAKLNITGGTISGGSTTASGGSLYINKGSVYLANATITGGVANGASSGGGNIYNGHSATITMDSGFITNGKSGECGGNIASFGTFIMNGGEISGGESGYGQANRNGGNVSMWWNTDDGASSVFTMNGGIIKGGVSGAAGSGVRIGKNGLFTMNGGEITDNTCKSNEGALWLSNVADGIILNGGKVSGNTGGNIYYQTGAALKAKLGEPLAEGSRFGIAMAQPGVFADDLTMDQAAAFFSDNTMYQVKYNAGTLVLRDLGSHEDHCVCGGEATIDGHDHKVIAWQALNFASAGTSSKSSARAYLNGTDVYVYIPASAAGFQWTKTIDVYGGQTVHLCLNGQRLTSALRLFNLYDGTIEICDCIGGAELRTTDAGGCIVYDNGKGGTFNIYSGSLIAADTAKGRYFAAVVLSGSANFNMYGGKLGNENKKGVIRKPEGGNGTGGTLMAFGANNEINIYGGVIEGCKVELRGGTIEINSVTTALNIYGGDIYGGETEKGGTIYTNGAINLFGGTIHGGKVNGNGGAICLESGTLNMTGGTITGGTAKNGGTIAVIGTDGTNGGTLNITGGTISDGTATENGGNVYIINTDESVSQTVTGATLTGGKAGYFGGNLYCYGGERGTYIAAHDTCPHIVNLKLGVTANGGSAVFGKDVYVGGTNLTMTGKSTVTDFYLDAAQRLAFENFDTASSIIVTMCVKGVISESGAEFKSNFPGAMVLGEGLALAAPMAAPEVTEFSTGFSRINIVPDDPTPLDGMGGDYTRQQNWVQPTAEDDIVYGSIVLLADGESWENTAVICSLDTLFTHQGFSARCAQAISDATGIPAQNISFSGTHTHNGVSMDEMDLSVLKYLDRLYKDFTNGVIEAIADLKPTELQVGSTVTQGLNFLRRYLMKDGTRYSSVDGNHYGAVVAASDIMDYEGVADKTMRAVKMVRDGKDIVLVNWQCHPGGGLSSSTIGRLSADSIGTMRMDYEGSTGDYMVFFQGTGGNMASGTKLSTDPEASMIPSNRAKRGQALADVLINMEFEDAQSGTIVVHSEKLQAQNKQSGTKNADGTVKTYDTYSYLPLKTFSFGDVAFCTASCELFAGTGLQIREGANYKMTLVASSSNGSYVYIPTGEAFAGDANYDSFEVRTSKHVAGTAEAIAEKLIEMVNDRPTDDVCYGDVNGDGVIDSLDGLLLMRYLNGWDVEIPCEQNMDVNADGVVDSLDGLLLMRFLNGWDVTLGG